MTFLALFLLSVFAWLAVGLVVAHRIQPKVTHLALMVIGSAALWPLTWFVNRRKQAHSGAVDFVSESVTDA